MSKFFAQGNISDEDNEAGSEENENQNRNGPSYQYDFMDDDRGNNQKRVVKTEKDKKWNIIKDLTVKAGNALNSQDFEKVWNILQELLKQIEKSAKLIEKEGYPPLFLRILKKINDEINEINENVQAKKKMKKHSATAFNTMKQKMKKIYPEYEKTIDELLAKGQESEKQSQEDPQDQSDQESEEQDDKKLLESPDPMVRRKYWLKKVTRKVSEEEENDKEKDKENEVKGDKKKKQQGDKTKKTFEAKKKTNIEIQSIKDAENRIKDIRKNFIRLHNQEQREEYLLTLDKISENSKSYKDFEKLSFLLLDIPIRIDVCRQMKLTHFPRNQWLHLHSKIAQIYHLLRQSQQDNLVQNIRLFDDRNEKSDVITTAKEQDIYLSLKTYLILIESQLKKALTYVDSNEPEYYERLQDLIALVNLMYRISKELQLKDDLEKDAAELAFKVIENTYFMDTTLVEKIKANLHDQLQFLELNKEDKIESYANLVLKFISEEQTKIKTLLYLIYNHAINHREKGKELLMISNLSQQILHQDYYTQALYNRALVQIGLNAFRNGNIFQVQQFLYQMCSQARMKQNTKDILKEFLAQGFSRLLNEKEIPKSKILPAYLHLNVDLIESVELVASMLLELPYTLTEGGRITSKTFKRFYYEYQRNVQSTIKQYFIEESLNNRDLIYGASLHLKQGDWQGCYTRLELLNIWPSIYDADTTRSNLLKIVKEQSLKCYLIGNRKCFKSISLSGLADKFALDEKAIRRLICKLINEKILQGSITLEGYLIFIQKKQSEVQKVCEMLFNRLEEMNVANENWFSQKVNAGYDSEQEQDKEDRAIAVKLPLAINEKLKSILSKRTEKY